MMKRPSGAMLRLPFRRKRPQAEPLDLPGRRLRQLLEKLNPPRPLVLGQPFANELLELDSEFRRRDGPRTDDNERQRLDQSVVILLSDDAAFKNGRMGDERVFDFDRTDPQPAHLQHVVRAARIPEKPLFVLRVLVAGADPVPLDRVLRLLVLVPVAGADRVASEPEIPDLVRIDRHAIVVEDAALVAVDDPPPRTRPDRATPVRNEHMPDYGP